MTEIVRVAARDLTGADGATFVLKEGELVHYADENAIGPLWKGRRFRAAECICGWAMEHREAVVIEDVFADPRIPQDAYAPTFVNSLAIVPIRIDDPVGAIGAYWAARRKATPNELEALQIIADAAAMAFDRVSLARALRAQDEMLRIVTHDMRTPLNTIGMAATLLAHVKDDGELGERVRKHAAVIKRATARIDGFIGDLADSAAIEAGALSLRDGSCTVGAILEQVRDLEPLAAERNHTLVVEPLEEDAPMSCAPERVVQAIGNLVRNAVTHTPDGTRVRVAASVTDAHVTFRVEDDGPGIPEQARARLFKRYAHGPSRSSGSGLGLFIVKGIVEAHRGTVQVETDATGTRFTIVLPRRFSEKQQRG